MMTIHPKQGELFQSDTLPYNSTSADLYLGDGDQIEFASKYLNPHRQLFKGQSYCKILQPRIWPQAQASVRDCVDRPDFSQ